MKDRMASDPRSDLSGTLVTEAPSGRESALTGPAPLAGIRVVDLSTGIAGAYTTKLFIDAGAEVIKVEPPSGDPLRRWSASGATGDAAGALFRFLAAGKHSVVGSPDDAEIAQLIAGADLVVDSGDSGLDPAALHAGDSRLVVVSITPYGLTGPYAGRPATEFTVQAECGSIAGRGTADRPPVQAGGRIAEWSAGATAAAAALPVLRRSTRTGEGALLDVSWFEVMVLATNLYSDLMFSLMGRPAVPGPPRSVELPSIDPTSDGWIGFNTNGAKHFRAFAEMIERPDIIGHPQWGNIQGRVAARAEWDALVRAYTTSHTTEEILQRAEELRVPTARVNDGRSVLTEAQTVARDFYTTDPITGVRAPRPHYLRNGARPAPPGPAPKLGADDAASLQRVRPALTSEATGALPLEGLKVLDLTAWWAGPAVAQLLAAMGADAIHIESLTHLDPMRLASAVMFLGRDRWWEFSGFHMAINPNKKGVTLDLSSEEGRALTRELVKWADVVVENYTPRVLERWGLDWDAVHELNPKAVMMRMPAFGLDGPWRGRLGFAQTVEQMSGMAWVTGFASGEPLVPRGPCDPIGGMHASFAVMVALAARDATGEGQLVEASLLDSALNMTAEQVIEYTATGTVLTREGNRSPSAAPQGLYACHEPSALGTGDEQWLALSVATDEQWEALVKVLGSPVWTEDPQLATHAGRRAAEDRLDAVLGSWAQGRDVSATVDLLISAGIPAATLTNPRNLSQHPHLAARGYLEQVPNDVVGTHGVPGLPLRMSGVDRWIRKGAPLVGEHNAEVLGGVLGLSDADLDRLAAAGVIGTEPPAPSA
jgi:crotonobetainyl-CoA:carnitine CoA-transferase CaiB-like acyl-CoA transferase